MGQTAPKNKGKISRMLAAKAALCVRVDALAEDTDTTVGQESRGKVEGRLRQLEQVSMVIFYKGGKSHNFGSLIGMWEVESGHMNS